MKVSLVVASCFAAASAAPAALTWTPELGLWFRTIHDHIREAKSDRTIDVPSCTLKNANMDTSEATTPLPSPTGSLTAVVLGRGVQNYTCDLSNSTAVPKAIGAIANLYDMSCMASNNRFQDLLDQAPNLALQYPLPQDSNSRLSPSNIQRIGHHYFDASGVPTFDLNDGQSNLGVAKVKVAFKTPAPASSVKGQNGQGYGSVPWLQLLKTDGGSSSVSQVYRIQTAGGQPPATCQGADAAFSVEYSALYYMWS